MLFGDNCRALSAKMSAFNHPNDSFLTTRDLWVLGDLFVVVVGQNRGIIVLFGRLRVWEAAGRLKIQNELQKAVCVGDKHWQYACIKRRQHRQRKERIRRIQRLMSAIKLLFYRRRVGRAARKTNKHSQKLNWGEGWYDLGSIYAEFDGGAIQ